MTGYYTSNGETKGLSLHVLVRETLKQAGIVYTEQEGSPSSFHFQVPASHGKLAVAIRVVPEAEEILVYSGLPIKFQEPQRQTVLEATAWINMGLRRSSFDVDQDRSQLVCRTCLWGEQNNQREALEVLLRCNLDTANHYLKAFNDIFDHGHNVRDAVTKCQHSAGLDIT